MNVNGPDSNICKLPTLNLDSRSLNGTSATQANKPLIHNGKAYVIYEAKATGFVNLNATISGRKTGKTFLKPMQRPPCQPNEPGEIFDARKTKRSKGRNVPDKVNTDRGFLD